MQWQEENIKKKKIQNAAAQEISTRENKKYAQI